MNHLYIHEECDVINLSSVFNVSVETIRRDLNVLDSSGQLLRTHGGAKVMDNTDIGSSFSRRMKTNAEGKRVIANNALDYILEGEVIGLDASSASWFLAQAIPNISLTVITNSLDIVQVLSKKNNINTICLGGSYSEKYSSFYGNLTTKNLQRLSIDMLFMACSSFDPIKGVWESNEHNATVKQAMISSSDKVVLLAEKNKRNKRGLIKLADFEDIDIIITDDELCALDSRSLEGKDILVI